MRLLVCGGRTYSDIFRVEAELTEINPELVIHGGANGADTLAGMWADKYGVPCMVFPPAWTALGNKAGVVRNEWMLSLGKPDLVLAFPGGRGTEDMVRRSKHAGIPVRLVTQQ